MRSPIDRTADFTFTGGLNVSTPQIRLDPGFSTAAINYETALTGGYRRIPGYEPMDGRASPADATYERLPFVNGGTGVVMAGDTVTGQTSGATGYVLLVSLDGGDWTLGTAYGSIFITARAGVFTTTENLLTAATYRAKINGAIAGKNIGEASYKAAMRASQAYSRAQIQKVPGSGSILGVWLYKGNRYAFRNSADGTQALMYRATAGGWVQIPFLYEVGFSAGSAAPAEGAVITQGGATARVRRVVLESGTWASNTAQGRFIVDTLVAAFAAGAFTAGTTATCAGPAAAITLKPNGVFEFENHNFFGGASTRRMYGCDAVNRMFEFDDTGDIFTPITTPMTPDVPQHLAIHKNYLFATYAGGYVQRCGVYSPYQWTALTGAAVLGLGDDLTGIYSVRNDYLGAWTVNTIQPVYGSTSADFQVKTLTKKLGALPRSILEIAGKVLHLDVNGVYEMEATQRYGDFIPTPLSQYVQPLFAAKGTGLVCSVVSKKRNIGRWFFNDKTAISVSVLPDPNGARFEWLYSKFKHQFTCVCAGEGPDGLEMILAGSDDGFVYQLDKGSSFAGQTIPSVMRLAYSDQQMPLRKKRYKRLHVSGAFPSPSALNVRVDTSYGVNPSGIAYEMDMPTIGGNWGEVTWGAFAWGGAAVATFVQPIEGAGSNVSLTFVHEDDIDDPHTLQVGTIVYDIMGMQR